MKAVIQRVFSASVAVEGKTISSIGQGLMVLIGIDRNDGPNDAAAIIKKILNAKLFDDENGTLWQKSVKEINGQVLCVSQFTLFATFKGAKPDFREAMSTIPGKAFYNTFMEDIRAAYDTTKIQEGQFGAMMAVSLVNDGPTTILLNSREMSRSSTSNTPSGSSTPAISAAAEESQRRAEEQKAIKAAKRAEFEANIAKKAAAKAEQQKEFGAKRAQRAAAGTSTSVSHDGTPAGDQVNSVERVSSKVEGLEVKDKP